MVRIYRRKWEGRCCASESEIVFSSDNYCTSFADTGCAPVSGPDVIGPSIDIVSLGVPSGGLLTNVDVSSRSLNMMLSAFAVPDIAPRNIVAAIGLDGVDAPRRHRCTKVVVLSHLVAGIGRLASGAGRCRTTAPSLTLVPPPCRSKPKRLVAITFRSSGTG